MLPFLTSLISGLGASAAAPSAMSSIASMFDTSGGQKAMEAAQKASAPSPAPLMPISGQKPIDIGLLTRLIQNRSQLGS